MKRKHKANIFFSVTILLLSLISSPVFASLIDVGNQVSPYTGLTRGYWFTAPEDLVITGIGVPTDASTDSFDVAVMRFPAAPPSNTQNFETLFLSRDNNQTGLLDTKIAIAKGDIIGVLGSRGADSTNSYGPTDYVTQIKGAAVTLMRFVFQDDLRTTDPSSSTLMGQSSGNIGRVLLEIATVDVGAENATYTGQTRGYWFTAPEDLTITGLGVPTDASTESFDVAVMRFPSAPPSGTQNFETLFLSRDNNQEGMLVKKIIIKAGDIIGVLGSRGADSTNSYGPSGDYVSEINGTNVTLTRLYFQADLRTTDPSSGATLESNSGGNIGRVWVDIDGILPFPWALFLPKKLVELPDPQWTVKSGVCCTLSNITFSVSLAGTTKSSTSTPCPSTATVEDYRSSTAGTKNFSYNISGGCLNETGTFSYTFQKGRAYTFVTYLDGTEVKIGVLNNAVTASQAQVQGLEGVEIHPLSDLEEVVNTNGISLGNGLDVIEECSAP